MTEPTLEQQEAESLIAFIRFRGAFSVEAMTATRAALLAARQEGRQEGAAAENERCTKAMLAVDTENDVEERIQALCVAAIREDRQ